MYVLLFKKNANEWLGKEDGISLDQNGSWVLCPNFWFRKSGVLAPQPSCPVQRPSALGKVLGSHSTPSSWKALKARPPRIVLGVRSGSGGPSSAELTPLPPSPASAEIGRAHV